MRRFGLTTLLSRIYSKASEDFKMLGQFTQETKIHLRLFFSSAFGAKGSGPLEKEESCLKSRGSQMSLINKQT